MGTVEQMKILFGQKIKQDNKYKIFSESNINAHIQRCMHGLAATPQIPHEINFVHFTVGRHLKRTRQPTYDMMHVAPILSFIFKSHSWNFLISAETKIL